ncbi:hybrid sensor histidine kinase/response regulator [Alteromonas sediminis]|uniref:histidine kinase n=1 Tax=Alteromonas sediminis TaxID=2259342 RepID=A0A3N5ZAX4_9ALTE|nr:hybrid sensor histidine kinase/response regulator [Alteromonas sediminis]RPJ68344.1 hybrid sensor histidine kinase/response regulator [Alteromonas sediminis]
MEHTDSASINLVPSPILVVDITGHIRLINDYLSEVFLYAPHDLIGKPISAFIPELEQNSVTSDNSFWLQSPNSTTKRVFTAYKKNKQPVAVELFVNRTQFEIIVLVTDVTRREAAIESLNISQSINKTATWYYDLLSEQVWWSPELFRIFGLPVSEHAPPYETHHKLFTPSSWQLLQPAVANAAERGTPYELELELNSKGDDRRFAVARCEPILDDAGRVTRLVGTFQDVSTLKEAKLALEETALRLNESIVAGGIALWDWNLVTNEARFSDEYKRQLGYEAHEINDSYAEWERRVHPEDLEETLQKIANVTDDGQRTYEAVFRMQHKNGDYRWIMSHATSFLNEEGKPVRLLGSHTDITDRIELQNKLKEAQKMEALGQLAGGVAHDFNNQLSSIMGFAELISASNDLDSSKTYVGKIIACAENASNLTRQLLAFSRQDKTEFKPLDLHKLISDTIDIISHSIDKRISIDLRLNASLHIVKGDYALLQNALLNLGLNARDAMPKGGTIFIQTETIPTATGKGLHVIFSDTGCGIKKEDLNKIFTPFFTTKAVGKGTGLGLASAYGTIENMGGNIKVTSTVGEGTRFDIDLPVYDSTVPTEQTTPCQDAQPDRKRKILLVDDEAMIRELCAEFLDSLGHEALLAKDGEDAIELFKHNVVDLVILDMIMPKLDGKQTYLALKAIDSSVKAIVASGFMAENSESELLSMGVIDIIKKPYRLAELNACINKVLS